LGQDTGYESYEEEIISSNNAITASENNIRDAKLNDALENLSSIPKIILDINEVWYRDYYTQQIKELSSEYKESNSTLIGELDTAKNTGLEEMIATLDSILLKKEEMAKLDAFEGKVTNLRNNISSSYYEYEIISKIQVDYLKLSEFIDKLRAIEPEITTYSMENLDYLRKISNDYTAIQGDPEYLSLFKEDGGWVENRASFFNDFYEASIDVKNLESTKVDSYDPIMLELEALNRNVPNLKFEADKESIVKDSINNKISYVGQLENNKNKLKYTYIIILAISSIIAVSALVYIFIISNNKKQKAKKTAASKFLEGRTLLIFESRKIGTLIHSKEIEYYAESDVGLKRELNEDSIGITFNRDASKGLFVLADGMGGHNAGEVASKIAIQTVLEHGKNELFTYQRLSSTDIKDILRHIVYTAHEEILNMSKCNPEMCDMGTTLEVVFLNEDHVYYAHVGDSRIYMTYLDDGYEESISKVTTDHSELGLYMEKNGVTEEEARKNVPSNVITQAVGITSNPLSPDVGDFKIGKDNWILICSDGLTDMVQDDCYIGKVIIHKKLDIKGKVNELVRAAKDMGGKDNISLILFRRR
jgi:protein phosphatase